jgi:hypothetical protein
MSAAVKERKPPKPRPSVKTVGSGNYGYHSPSSSSRYIKRWRRYLAKFPPKYRRQFDRRIADICLLDDEKVELEQIYAECVDTMIRDWLAGEFCCLSCKAKAERDQCFAEMLARHSDEQSVNCA